MDDSRARERIAAERSRVEAALQALDVAVATDGPLGPEQTDRSDAGSELTTEMVDVALRDRLEEELASIERAEERIRAGTYGRSIDSGLPIPAARLDAEPLAERTIEEQRAHEAGR
jgi:DnaK suppressor protein